MLINQEIRTLATQVQIAEQRSDDGQTVQRTITGYALKWEELSLPISGLFFEKFQKGAFDDSIKSDDQRMLWNHNCDLVLGRRSAGTLKLVSDDTGLRFDAVLPENCWGDFAYEAIQRRDIDGVSFAFNAVVQEWDESDPENIIRTVCQAQLFEISPCTFPAYPQTTIATRSIEDAYMEYRELQKPEPVPEEKPVIESPAEPENTPLAEPEEIPQVESQVEPVDTPVVEPEDKPIDDSEHRNWIWGIRRKINATN